MFSCPPESETKMLYNFLIDSSGVYSLKNSEISIYVEKKIVVLFPRLLEIPLLMR